MMKSLNLTTATDLICQGTDEFMSDDMLEAAKLDMPYLQSPVDDLWSFYYVAQWAAVFNNTNFPGDTPVPIKLAELRRLIAGSQADRALGTRKVTRPALDQIEYGQFLADSYCILREWEFKLNQLTADWSTTKFDHLTADLYDKCYPCFRNFTDRGVLELIQLAQQHFPDHFSE